MGTGGPLPWDNAWPGRDAEYSTPSSAEVMNIPPLPPSASMASSGVVLLAAENRTDMLEVAYSYIT
jgi:hypothetical protein